MELGEFVKATLVQIVEGVKHAQEAVGKSGAIINPGTYGSPGTSLTVAEVGKKGLWHPQLFEFDVALTVEEGKGTKGGIGVLAGIVDLGSQGHSESHASSVSRVKFAVYVALPRPKDNGAP